jgi:DNA-binding transcriptional LysR family regulator
MMTFAQLRTFEAVARLNSFSRAAEELHLTQPAVSAQVVALENALKLKVFDRVGKTFTITEQGRVVLQCAQDIQGRVGQLQRELEDLSAMNRGTLRIGASHVVGVYLLPEILSRFRVLYPQVELGVKVQPYRSVIELLLRGELDIAVVGGGHAMSDDRIAAKPIMEDELVVVAAPHDPITEAGSISVADLCKLSFVMPARDTASGESILDQLNAYGVTLNSIIEFGNVGAVKKAVEAGMGISILSRYAVSRELQEGRLQTLAVHGLSFKRHVFLCWHQDRPFSKLTTAFVHFIQRHAGVAIGSDALEEAGE